MHTVSIARVMLLEHPKHEGNGLMDTGNLLAHLAWNFCAHPENIATKSLGFVLNQNEPARKALSEFLAGFNVAVSADLEFVGQDVSDEGSILDLVGRDSSKDLRLIIEGKFWAGLTANQPVNYLKLLGRSGVLLFVVPTVRMDSVWVEILQRAAAHKPIPMLDSKVLAAVTKNGQVLVVAGWSHLLGHIGAGLKDGHLANMAQLIGLCDCFEREGERKVISIPAAKSIDTLEKTLIHACPDKSPWNRYRRTGYVTFRRKGGAMTEVFKVDLVVKFQPWSKYIPTGVSEPVRQRLADYIEWRRRDWPFGTEGPYTFYVLSENRIPLPHHPTQRCQGHCYFTLDELRSGTLHPRIAKAVETV